MDGMISAKEAAGKWKLTSTRVAQMCRNGEIPGAQKGKKEWLIPINAVKPMDKRRKKQPESDIHFGTLLPLPIGISEYRLASTHYYYIDKTMLIKDFLDERPKNCFFMDYYLVFARCLTINTMYLQTENQGKEGLTFS